MTSLPKNKTFQVMKLVRDKVYNAMQNNSVSVSATQLDGNALSKALKNKLVEEANEVANALTEDEIIEECADCLEVIDNLIKLYNINKNKVLDAQRNKYQEKGNFLTGRFVHHVCIDKTCPMWDYYHNNMKRYPQINI